MASAQGQQIVFWYFAIVEAYINVYLMARDHAYEALESTVAQYPI